MAARGPIAHRDRIGDRLASVPRWASYLVAAGVIMLAAVLRIWPLTSLGSTLTWITFYPAVLVAAVVGGLGSGLFATGLTCMATIVGWPLLVDTPFIKTRGDWLGVAVFIFSGALISALAEAMRRANTRARLANQHLKAEKDRFAALVDNSPAAVSVRALADNRYTLVNDAFCRLFGYESAEDVIGRIQDDVLPPEVLERSRQAALGLRAGKELLQEELIRQGPHDRWVMTQRFALRDVTGAAAELVTIRTDFTEQRKALQNNAEREIWERRIGAPTGDERLLVYSQPIIDIATRETVEEELLVRLRVVDKQTGIDEVWLPSQFLPQCEHHHLMPVIDRYMTARAIELARIGKHVSVNIAGQTIADENAIRAIIAALTDAGPTVAERIMVEITETTALASPELAEEFSRHMRDLGCRVALDDFGTGYGTFTELRHLHTTDLKIDQTFVRNLVDNPDDERMVTTIVFVAQTYGLRTIAEGVESDEALQRLAELGADRAQGYLFGKPRPIVV